MSVRIHAIAKEVNKTSKEIVELLKSRGYDIKSASSTLDNITAQSIIEEFGTSEEDSTKSDLVKEQTDSVVEDEKKEISADEKKGVLRKEQG